METKGKPKEDVRKAKEKLEGKQGKTIENHIKT